MPVRLKTSRKYVDPITTYCTAIRLGLRNHNPELCPFQLTIGTPATPTQGTVHTNFGFSTPSASELPVLDTKKRTDRQTDGQDPYCGLL